MLPKDSIFRIRLIQHLRSEVVFVLVILYSIGNLAYASKADCEAKIRLFLENPNQHTYLRLSDPQCANCWKLIGSSNLTLNALIKSVEKGNNWAAKYLTENISKLDGGNLEDSLIALGQFSEHDMENFLMLSKDGQLSTSALGDALTMLPLSLSDNPQAQLNVLRVRKKLLLKIHRADLHEQRKAAILAIDDFIKEIEQKNYLK